MLLAIDAGNTNTVLGLFRLATDETPAELIADWRITTPLGQTSDEIGVTLRSLFVSTGHELSVVNGIAISSVVPPLDSTLRKVCEIFFKVKPLFIEPGVKTGLPVLTDNPAEVGADRIVNCVAAFDKYGVLKLTLRPESYRWEFIDVDDRVLDTGEQPVNQRRT